MRKKKIRQEPAFFLFLLSADQAVYPKKGQMDYFLETCFSRKLQAKPGLGNR